MIADASFRHGDDEDTARVELRLIEIELTHIGAIRAYAAVSIEVAGVEFVVQGVAVLQMKREIRVDLPSYQRDGRRLPCFCLPDELHEPIGRLVLDEFKAMQASAGVAR